MSEEGLRFEALGVGRCVGGGDFGHFLARRADGVPWAADDAAPAADALGQVEGAGREVDRADRAAPGAEPASDARLGEFLRLVGFRQGVGFVGMLLAPRDDLVRAVLVRPVRPEFRAEREIPGGDLLRRLAPERAGGGQVGGVGASGAGRRVDRMLRGKVSMR